MSIRYKPNGFLDRLTTPARIYTLRTIWSLIPAALYGFAAISIGTSRFMTGPRAVDSYFSLGAACCGVAAASFAFSLHQATMTAYAGLLWKLWRQYPST